MAKFDSGHYLVIAKGIAACPEAIRGEVRNAFVRVLTERSDVFDVMAFDKAVASCIWHQGGIVGETRQPDRGKANLRNVP